jgi:hypothetical protein
MFTDKEAQAAKVNQGICKAESKSHCRLLLLAAFKLSWARGLSRDHFKQGVAEIQQLPNAAEYISVNSMEYWVTDWSWPCCTICSYDMQACICIYLCCVVISGIGCF